MNYENTLRVEVPVSKLLVNGFSKEQIKEYVDSEIKAELKDRLHTVVDGYCNTLAFETIEKGLDGIGVPNFSTEVYVKINLIPVVKKYPIQIKDVFTNGLFREEN